VAFPSRTEGFGLPPAEAMACGCPAVVAPSGAIPEVCADAALYADVDDPGQWVDAIRAYADQPHLREQKAAMGRERMSAYPWDRAGRELFDHILRLSGTR
jgi:glycosyltransferase involved in cell wall biosynthesis